MKRSNRRCGGIRVCVPQLRALQLMMMQVAADLVSKLPYILQPVGVLILTLLGFAVFM